jgi:(1->4)-alpha-D-glucan 1-alpha-D-glucosylmutase
LSLVDPDNRRPVDFEVRQQHLANLENVAPEELLAHWQDGRIKLWTIHRLLSFRSEHAALFARGSYGGLASQGTFAENVIAFDRQWDGMALTVIVPRHTVPLGFPPLGSVWQETQLHRRHTSSCRDIFTGQTFEGGTLPLADALAFLPFAVLVAE